MHRKTAKELLADSFRELAQTRSIDRITIGDICVNCGYSPATFYRCFRDKYDLIAWDYSRRTARIMGLVDGKTYEWKQTLLDGAKHFHSEKEYLANLFQHTSGHDSCVRSMTEINFDLLKRHFLSASGKDALSPSDELYLRIYCLGTVCLTCEWLLDKYDASPEQIAEVYENSLPLPLRKHLMN